MKPAPSNWSRLSVGITYKEPNKAIDWLCKAFGFELRLKIDDGQGGIAHSELTFGEAVIMVGGGRRPWQKSPRDVNGANTQACMLYVDDAEAQLTRAEAAGAEIFEPLKETDYGPEYWKDRGFGCTDLEGHHWWFYERISQ